MTIEETIRAKLLADSAVAGYLDDRFYPVPADHETVTPFAAYSLVSWIEQSDMGGKTGLISIRLQLSFMADDWKTARDVTMECRRVVLDPAIRGTWDDVTIDSIFVADLRDMGREDVTNLYRHDLDLEIWIQS